MKVYIHFEDSNSPEYTKRFTIKTLTDPASKIVTEFVDSYNHTHGKGIMTLDLVVLKTADGKVLDLSEPLNVKDKSDLYITLMSVKTSKTTMKTTVKTTVKSTSVTEKKTADPYRSIVSKAEKLESSQHLKEARSLWQQLLSSDEYGPLAGIKLGHLVARNKNHELAAKYFSDAISLAQKLKGNREELIIEAKLGEGQAYAALGNMRVAAERFQSVVSSPGKFGVDAKVGMARLLLDSGHAQEAADMVMGALSPPYQEHIEGLLLYATIAERYEKNEEALSVLLRLVVTNKEHVPVKRLLAKMFAKSGSIELLKNTVPLNVASSSAYAFLATVAKDHGAVDAACELLLLAHRVQPDNHSYALNYVHALELKDDLSLAWNALLKHMSNTTQCTVAGVSNGAFLAAAADGRSDLDWDINWITTEEPYADCSVAGFVPTPVKRQALNDESLDILALWFAGVKIRYLMGASIISLVACIEPARRSSKQLLHSTTIRNEHAYYCCVAQVKASHCLTKTDVMDHSGDKIYLCGDSHSLSPAWQKFPCQDKEVVLTPKLVTGLKHWHLRPEEDFYPKIHFERVVKTIPSGSTVVFIFGEIDCREGILLAVQKDRYETIEEGMRCTLGYYISKLEALAKNRKFTILVHPIVPVLDETRSLVIAYNTLLRESVLKSGSLRWLGGRDDSLFKGLLTQDMKLEPEFVLDGTHLHPSYLRLLGPAISQALEAEVGEGV